MLNELKESKKKDFSNQIINLIQLDHTLHANQLPTDQMFRDMQWHEQFGVLAATREILSTFNEYRAVSIADGLTFNEADWRTWLRAALSDAGDADGYALFPFGNDPEADKDQRQTINETSSLWTPSWSVSSLTTAGTIETDLATLASFSILSASATPLLSAATYTYYRALRDVETYTAGDTIGLREYEKTRYATYDATVASVYASNGTYSAHAYFTGDPVEGVDYEIVTVRLHSVDTSNVQALKNTIQAAADNISDGPLYLLENLPELEGDVLEVLGQHDGTGVSTELLQVFLTLHDELMITIGVLEELEDTAAAAIHTSASETIYVAGWSDADEFQSTAFETLSTYADIGSSNTIFSAELDSAVATVSAFETVGWMASAGPTLLDAHRRILEARVKKPEGTIHKVRAAATGLTMARTSAVESQQSMQEWEISPLEALPAPTIIAAYYEEILNTEDEIIGTQNVVLLMGALGATRVELFRATGEDLLEGASEDFVFEKVAVMEARDPATGLLKLTYSEPVAEADRGQFAWYVARALSDGSHLSDTAVGAVDPDPLGDGQAHDKRSYLFPTTLLSPSSPLTV